MLFKNSKAVITLSDKDFEGKKIKKNKFNKPGFIFCYATWCPHCQSKETTIQQIAQNNKNISVYVLEADQNSYAASMIGVPYFPTIKKVGNDGVIGQMIEFEQVKNMHMVNQNGGSCGNYHMNAGKPVNPYKGLNYHKINTYVKLKNNRIAKIIKNKNGKKTLTFA